MTSQSHVWRYCCIVISRGPWSPRGFFKRGFGDHRKQPISGFNWIVISIEIHLIKTANQMAKIITLSVCKWFQTTIFIQIKSRKTKWWRHFPIPSSSWLSILPHQYGGQKTKSLHCEMNSLHVISKQPTLLGCCLRQHALRECYDMMYQLLGMEAKNYKFGMYCQQCHPPVAPGNADIQPRNASWIHTCHLFTS